MASRELQSRFTTVFVVLTKLELLFARFAIALLHCACFVSSRGVEAACRCLQCVRGENVQSLVQAWSFHDIKLLLHSVIIVEELAAVRHL